MVPTMDSTDIPNEAAPSAPLVACPHCAAQMPETAGFCPGCGRSMEVEQPFRGKVGPLTENIAGTLAYFTFIPAIVFLVLDPYNKNRFVRFHSLQCLFLCGAWTVVNGAGLHRGRACRRRDLAGSGREGLSGIHVQTAGPR